MITLGYDGLSTDETATVYAIKNGKLIATLWGSASEVEPKEAIRELEGARVIYQRTADFDGTSSRRVSAIESTINRIKDYFPAVNDSFDNTSSWLDK